MRADCSPGFVYRIFSQLLYPFWLLHALRHGRRHGQARYLSMRARGFSGTAGGKRVWIHASSVGEVNAIAPLVRALAGRGEKILFTSFTATGFAAIRQQFSDSVASGVIPIDCYRPCRIFFRRHPIKFGIVMETELWPELLCQAERHGIGMVLVNARLSAKSLKANAWIRGLLRNTLGCFERILARNSGDREAFVSLGVDGGQIDVVGNLKSRAEDRAEHSRIIERDYILLASSHADEEAQFLRAQPAELKSLLLVLAPRHPERGASIRAEIEHMGRSCAVRSLAQPVTAATEIYLADTLGELKRFLAHARVVVMGGSFDATGGHNLIEPAGFGRAIITGPSDSNIRDDIAMLEPGEGVLQVADMAECWRAIGELIDAPERAEAMGNAAKARLAAQPDIVEAYLDAIDRCLQQADRISPDNLP